MEIAIKAAPEAGTAPAPVPQRLNADAIRKALEELRDTRDEARAAELKKIIAYSICGV